MVIVMLVFGVGGVLIAGICFGVGYLLTGMLGLDSVYNLPMGCLALLSIIVIIASFPVGKDLYTHCLKYWSKK